MHTWYLITLAYITSSIAQESSSREQTKRIDIMNEKDEKEASGVRAMPPPPLPAAPSGDGSLFVEVNRHSTVSRSSTEESSIVTIQTLQRMKAEMMVQQTEMMQHMENEIEGVIRKHQMQGEDGMLILSTTDEERFEEDGTEKVRWQNSNTTHSFTVDCKC